MAIVIAVILLVILGYCSDQSPDKPANSNEPATETATQAPEEGLAAGFASVRVLDNTTLEALKLEAIGKGQDPGYMYPEQGPIALVTLPVNTLDSQSIKAVLPLLCEVTADKNPDRWAAYTQVRILNRHSYIGFLIDDWKQGCADNRVDRSVVGQWEAQFPWKLAKPVDSIGYGTYK